jgi:Sodium/hydrogen exchanger family
MSTGDSSSPESTELSTKGISAVFVLFSFLLATVLVLSKVLVHDHPAVNAWFPEAGMILCVGMVGGLLVSLFDAYLVPNGDGDDAYYSNSNINSDGGGGGSSSVASSLLSFSPQVFFVCLLPPIIFNSGYHLRRELFFRHITPIALFAVAGTLISTLSIALLLEIVKRLNLTGDFRPSM